MIRIKLFRLTNCKKKDIGWQKMAEEQPNFVVDQLFEVVGNNTNDSK